MKYFIILILILLIIMILLQLTKKKENFDNPSYNTEIHFLTFWRKNSIHEQNIVMDTIKKINNPLVRVIKKIKIKKQDIKKVFINVGSGGKHYNNDIDIFIIEVPNIYTIHNTHTHPNGEKVNDIMYKLKKAARGDYKNYNIAHGSFNIKETNDFLKEYFKLLGDFNNYEEVKSELNNSNIFWLYDRVTYNLFGKEADIDLVVDSIPAICFCLRKTDVNYKININVNQKKIPLDLRDFDSNYYPNEWLKNIKTKKLYLTKNNVKIPDLENHFMLGLYHMYIHKNGKQNDERITHLKNMSKKLGYKNIDIIILLEFINNNNYKIKKPLDKGVGFFIKELTRGGRLTKTIYFYNNKIYYLYKNKNKYDKDKNILTTLKQYNFTPKILYKNDTNLIIQIENVGEILDKTHRHILNKVDFKTQINYINTILKKKNIIHNDLNGHNLTVKNNKLYLIDFEHSILNNGKNPRKYNDAGITYCRELPHVKNENTFVEYLKNNKCLNFR